MERGVARSQRQVVSLSTVLYCSADWRGLRKVYEVEVEAQGAENCANEA